MNENNIEISPWTLDDPEDSLNKSKEDHFFIPSKFQNLKQSKRNMRIFLQEENGPKSHFLSLKGYHILFLDLT